MLVVCYLACLQPFSGHPYSVNHLSFSDLIYSTCLSPFHTKSIISCPNHNLLVKVQGFNSLFNFIFLCLLYHDLAYM